VKRLPWLSVKDASALLGVDPSTLRRWSDAGKLPVVVTPGGHRRYAEADIRTLASEGRTDPGELLALLAVHFVTNETERDTTLAEAGRIAATIGGACARRGIDVGETLHVYQRIHTAIIQQALSHILRQPRAPCRDGQTFVDLVAFLDHELLAMLRQYEYDRDGSSNGMLRKEEQWNNDSSLRRDRAMGRSPPSATACCRLR